MKMAPSSQQKRKHNGSEATPVCIIHVLGLKYGPIHLMNDAKDPEKKFQKLKEIKRRLLTQPLESPYRLEESCRSLPEVLRKKDGYHRECYQRFTMNLCRLKEPQVPSTEQTDRPRRSSSDHSLFHPDCIFCRSESRKKIKVRGTWTTEGLSAFERDGWKHVLEVAEKQHDENLLRRIRGEDLFTREAKYHPSCRANYTQNPERWQSTR